MISVYYRTRKPHCHPERSEGSAFLNVGENLGRSEITTKLFFVGCGGDF